MVRQQVGIPPSDSIWGEVRHASRFHGEDFALFVGSAEVALAELPDESVNTVVTSPPYWSVRDYEHPAQFGLEKDPDDYVERIVKVFREVYRVLTKDGSAWLNIGDTYMGGGRKGGEGWKRPKQLSMIPFRVAIALEDEGWWVRNVMVWHKPNAMPSSVTDRLTNSWEPVFLLTKSARYHFDLDAIRVGHRTDDSVERNRASKGGAGGKAAGKEELRRWLNSPRHRATIEGVREVDRRPNAPEPVQLAAYLKQALKSEGRSIKWVAEALNLPFERTRHYFRTDEIGSRLPPPETWEQLKSLLNLDSTYDEAMTVEVGDNVFRNHPSGRNPGDVQRIAVRPNRSEHFAVMPIQLAEFALKATLPMGGVVLDPFMGTGTTGIVARQLGGKFVGVDVRAEYMRDYLDESGYRGK